MSAGAGIGMTMIIVFAIVMMLIRLAQGKPAASRLYRRSANRLMGVHPSKFVRPLAPAALGI